MITLRYDDTPFLAYLEREREEILTGGKITFRWSQACVGYRLHVGGRAALGVETFMVPADGWKWLEETHGITRA